MTFEQIVSCQMPTGRRFKNLKGRKFGRLLVGSFTGIRITGSGRAYLWSCECDCSKTTLVAAGALMSGNTRSCGCLRDEVNRKAKTHGHKARGGSPEYRIWEQMRKRCGNQGHIAWKYYGGRGIKVCDRWLDFELFLSDMGPRPTSTHTIDRINNDGHYCLENCRWATRAEQSNNKRNNHWIEFSGKRLTITQWSKETGVPTSTINSRLKRGLALDGVLACSEGRSA